MDGSEIGAKGTPQTMHVELGKIREFARAIKDPNPLYRDPEHAAAVTGGVIAPPTFTMALAHWDDGRGRPKLNMDLRRVLHGEQEFEYLGLIRAGDVLTAVTRLAEVYEKAGSRGGTMKFRVLETELVNQRGELVLRSRSTLIETGRVVKKD